MQRGKLRNKVSASINFTLFPGYTQILSLLQTEIPQMLATGGSRKDNVQDFGAIHP